MRGYVVWQRKPGDRGHRGFGSLYDHVQTSVEDIAEAWAYDAVYESKFLAHVISGDMKKSIHSKKLSSTHYKARVGVYYGVYEERGTRYREGHPFFAPGCAIATRKALTEFRLMLKTGERRKRALPV